MVVSGQPAALSTLSKGKELPVPIDEEGGQAPVWWVVSLLPLSTLPKGKELPVPIGEEGGWAPEPVWVCWIRNHLPLAGFEPQIIQSIA